MGAACGSRGGAGPRAARRHPHPDFGVGCHHGLQLFQGSWAGHLDAWVAWKVALEVGQAEGQAAPRMRRVCIHSGTRERSGLG